MPSSRGLCLPSVHSSLCFDCEYLHILLLRNFQLTRNSIARVRRFGITGLKLDDYVMLNCTVWYTLLCVAFNQIASGGGSNLMTQEEIDALTPEIVQDRIRGSKWVFASGTLYILRPSVPVAPRPDQRSKQDSNANFHASTEHFMLMTILSTKLCMLIIYASITYVPIPRRKRLAY